MITAVAAWIACIWFFLRFLFHGLRIGGLAGSVLILLALFAAAVFLTCRRLFRPSRKQVQAAARLLNIRADRKEGDAP